MVGDGVRASTSRLSRSGAQAAEPRGAGRRAGRTRFDGKQGARRAFSRRRSAAGGRGARVSAGALDSPQVLMLSGPASICAATVLDLPGVGRNLHDHVYVHCLAVLEPVVLDRPQDITRLGHDPRRAALHHQPPRAAELGSGAGGYFARSQVNGDRIDLQIQMRPFRMLGAGGMYRADTIRRSPRRADCCSRIRPASCACVGRPGAGTAHAGHFPDRRARPRADAGGPAADPRIFRTAPFAEHFEREVMPGEDKAADEDLVAYMRETADSMYHPAGSCRMGSDEQAVVDARLRVHGSPASGSPTRRSCRRDLGQHQRADDHDRRQGSVDDRRGLAPRVTGCVGREPAAAWPMDWCTYSTVPGQPQRCAGPVPALSCRLFGGRCGCPGARAGTATIAVERATNPRVMF